MPIHRATVLTIASAIAALGPAVPLPAQGPAPVWVQTEHLGVLTPAATLRPLGLTGTDLGVSFPCGERLVFLFGDSWTADRRDVDLDSAGWIALAPLPASGVPAMRWFTRETGRFAGIAPRGTALPGMDVPVEGLVAGDRTYVFFSSGWDHRRRRHSHSVCAHTVGHDLQALALDHRAPTDRFVNVSIVVDAGTAWIFGTGHYRRSSVFLARVPVERLADRTAWRYWPGDAVEEAQGKALVTSDCLGELSVRRLGSGRWAMTANAALPRGIHLRMASGPEGPWSDPVVIFDPVRDRGYGVTMHQKNGAVGYDDGLAEPGREQEWGGEYGPYLVPEWCSSPKAGVHELVYTLSTWNPYTVRLLRTVVADAGTAAAPRVVAPVEERGPAPRNLDFAGGRTTGWASNGDAFTTTQHADGTWAVCTYVAPRGDAVTGELAQEFVVPGSAQELRGVVSGGAEAVQLWCDGELRRATRGVRSNETDVPFRWRLDDLRGARVRLVIADAATGRWGFVTVRGLALAP